MAKTKSRLPYLLRIIRARPRISLATALAIIVFVLLPSSLRIATQFLVAWDVGVAFYLVLLYALMTRSRISDIRRHSADLDEGRWLILVLTVGAAVASLAAILAELGTSQGAARTPAQLVVALITIVLSWFFIHSIFALHYAHEFYGDGAKQSGLNFPGEEEPDYRDFVYFAFVIGMTCQVSDVAVASRPIRSTVNVHGVVAFFFNTALLALSVNMAASAI